MDIIVGSHHDPGGIRICCIDQLQKERRIDTPNTAAATLKNHALRPNVNAGIGAKGLGNQAFLGFDPRFTKHIEKAH